MLCFKRMFIFLAIILLPGTFGGYPSMDYLYKYRDFKVLSEVPNELNEIPLEIKLLKDGIGSDVPNPINTDFLPIFDIRVDPLPEDCQTNRTPSNCAEATACTKRSGYYKIKPNQYPDDPFIAECDTYSEGGDWTVMQRRQDGTQDFFRKWSEYKGGFGDVEGEFFIGMDRLYALTNFEGPQELVVVMEMPNESTTYAKYDRFLIGDEGESYALKRIGRYSGTAGDSLRYHVGLKYSTRDQENDPWNGKCARDNMGAWWYNNCYHSNLNGKYGTNSSQGIRWRTLSTNTSLIYVKMMIRRRRYPSGFNPYN